MRHYGGDLVSESLCLLVKITRYSFVLLMNLVATVALPGRNLVGLLHPTIAEKSNKTIKPDNVYQNNTEKITKAQNFVPSVF